MKKIILLILSFLNIHVIYSQDVEWQVKPIEVTDSCVTLSFTFIQKNKNSIYFDPRAFYWTSPHSRENLWYGLPIEGYISSNDIDSLQYFTILPLVVMEDTNSNFYYFGKTNDCEKSLCSNSSYLELEWGTNHFIEFSAKNVEKRYTFDRQQFKKNGRVRFHYYYTPLNLNKLEKLGLAAKTIFLDTVFGETYTNEELLKRLENLPPIHIISNWFNLED